MNRDDIIRMAQEADVWIVGQEPYQAQLERFASLVAAHEREACAKVCEDNDAAWTETAWNDACHTCAAAIRARG
jgi:hypothetical protein